MVKIWFGILILMVFSSSVLSQSRLDTIRYTRQLNFSYGGVFTGTGDMFGHKIYIGSQYEITQRFGIDLNIAGSFINHTFYFNDNPEWARYEHSNGGELSSNLYLGIGKEAHRIVPFVGPTLRYSYEHHSRDYGISYNSDTGDYDWYADYDEELGFRLGFNIGLCWEIRINNQLYLGPKLSISYFPRDGYIFSYLGIHLQFN